MMTTYPRPVSNAAGCIAALAYLTRAVAKLDEVAADGDGRSKSYACSINLRDTRTVMIHSIERLERGINRLVDELPPLERADLIRRSALDLYKIDLWKSDTCALSAAVLGLIPIAKRTLNIKE